MKDELPNSVEATLLSAFNRAEILHLERLIEILHSQFIFVTF